MNPPAHSPSLRIALYEGPNSRPVAAGDRFRLLKTLLEKGYAVTCTHGIADIAPADNSVLLVLARFENGSPPPLQDTQARISVRFHDIDGREGLDLEKVLEIAVSQASTRKRVDWKPWFPVIDYDRCTNCMQCLSFCLFDVYASSPDGKILVQNPHKCKTDCPACSRVCPEVAILFPKYKAGPINGDVVKNEDLQREKMKIDISALLGGDIYSLLRERSQRAQSRFSKERDDQRALKERQRCLAKLQQELDIPPEVLMSLPSQEEILLKTERSRAAALQALDRQST